MVYKHKKLTNSFVFKCVATKSACASINNGEPFKLSERRKSIPSSAASSLYLCVRREKSERGVREKWERGKRERSGREKWEREVGERSGREKWERGKREERREVMSGKRREEREKKEKKDTTTNNKQTNTYSTSISNNVSIWSDVKAIGTAKTCLWPCFAEKKVKNDIIIKKK